MGEDEERAIIERILDRAAVRIGSLARLAAALDVSFEALRAYREGKAKPPDELLLGAVELILDELPAIRRSFSKVAWDALSLPQA